MGSLQVALAKLRWSLHHRGVFGTVTKAATRLMRGQNPSPPTLHPFDIRNGVDTSGMITSVHLTTGSPNDLLGTGYLGSSPSRFCSILKNWVAAPPQQPISDYSFIDIGCGKGRAVMLATAYPFRDVIGVELHPGLAQIAAANLKKWNASHGAIPPARIACQDALEFEFPATPCLLYLYNPFAESILRQLIDRIAQSVAANPRAIDILYCNPKQTVPFDGHPSFQQIWTRPIPISAEDAAADAFVAPDEVSSLYRAVPR